MIKQSNGSCTVVNDDELISIVDNYKGGIYYI